MTEAEWLNRDDPAPMLALLQQQGKRRKLQLFCCAACRQVQRLMRDELSRAALEVAERRADGLASEREVRAARVAAKAVYEASLAEQVGANWDGLAYAACNAAGAARWVLTVHYLTTARLASYVFVGEKYHPAGSEPEDRETFRALVSAEAKEQTSLLREIAGNPFQSVALSSAWCTPAVLRLAQAAYEERALPEGRLDPARLAILADALKEAGCTDAELLAHLRSPGPHVRGCFALDAVLGKS